MGVKGWNIPADETTHAASSLGCRPLGADSPSSASTNKNPASSNNCLLTALEQDVKTGSSRWLKEQADFRRFEGWQDGYGAFTATFSGSRL